MIIKFIITVIGLIILGHFTVKSYKKCKSFPEKITYILLFIIFAFPTFMYYLDSFNIAAILGYTDNIDSKGWLELLFNYGAAIVAQIISAVVLFFITRMQIDEASKENYERDKEERRISNMPLLKYSFIDSIPTTVNILDTKTKKGSCYYLGLFIDNIGDSAIRKCYVGIKSNILKKDYIFKISEQGCLASKQNQLIAFDMRLDENVYNLTITVYYQDLIHNWYSQDILLEYATTKYHISPTLGYPESIKKYEIKDEVLLKELPTFEFDN